MTVPTPLLLELLHLKELPRTGWLRAGVASPESVAAHSWSVGLLALLLSPPELERGRLLAMALLHDLAELRTGDLTPRDPGYAEKSRAERRALRELLGDLPRGPELLALWEDYEAGASPEARFVRACDRLDMGLQAALYARSRGLGLEEFIESARRGAGELAALLDGLDATAPGDEHGSAG